MIKCVLCKAIFIETSKITSTLLFERHLLAITLRITCKEAWTLYDTYTLWSR